MKVANLIRITRSNTALVDFPSFGHRNVSNMQRLRSNLKLYHPRTLMWITEIEKTDTDICIVKHITSTHLCPAEGSQDLCNRCHANIVKERVENILRKNRLP